ncbi:MAG: putative photosynthetic complex assembly protein PuhE [Burkholderiaceae bacterium]
MNIEPSSLHLWMPLVFSIAVWWLSTGIILRLVDGAGPGRQTRALVAASLALTLGLAGVVPTRDMTTPLGAYLAFVSALLVWSWQEITFLVGLVTGPNRQPCPEVKGWARAWHAFRTIAHHEAALVLLGAAVILPSWDAANPVAYQTFLVLWAMRLSAKLNLFLGVKNFYESFLPPSLHYLLTYFSRRSFNLFFPVSLSLATLVAVFLWEQAWLGESAYEIAASSLVASLLALAILEHLLLVLPIHPERLWRWAWVRQGG